MSKCKNLESSLFIGYDVNTNEIFFSLCQMKTRPFERILSYNLYDFRKQLDSGLDVLQVAYKARDEFSPTSWTFNSTVKGCCPVEDGQCDYYNSNKPFTSVAVSISTICNLQCRFCGWWKEKEKIPLYEDAAERFRQIREIYFIVLNQLRGKVKSLRLTEVGEPFAFGEESERFLLSLTNADFEEVYIVTNGTLLTQKVIQALSPAPNKPAYDVTVSLNGWDRESYIDITGKDFFDRVLKNIYALQSTGVKIKVSFVIDKEDNVEKVYRFIKNNNFKKWHVHAPIQNQSINTAIYELENKIFFQIPQSQYKECIKYSSMHLRAVDNQIQALKCCLKYEPGEALKSWSFEEFSKIPDIWAELEALNNVTPPTHDDSIPAICPFKDVKKCRWDWKTWPLTRLEIGFEPHCNAHCRFCHIHPAIDNFYTKEEKQLLKDIYFKTLKSIKGKHLERVQLSEQGEPFFFKDETLEYLLSLTPEDTKEVSAFTNFTILTENDIRMLYENIKIKFIPIVSFHGWDPKSYSELTGMNEDYFYRVLNNCKTAVQCGAELESIFVIDDINNLEKVYNFIIENNDIFKDRWHIQNEILQPEISEKISAFLNEKAQQK